MGIPRAFIDQLNDRIDLPRFIEQYVPQLKKTSSDEWQACCPFHEDKTPSFTVSENKGFYHCFGCGAHGNAYEFVMEHKGVKFPEAVEEVAAFVGLAIPKPDRPERSDQEKKEAARYMRALDALDRAANIYSRTLYENLEAMSYLAERGVLQASIERFGLGYAPNAWNTITGSKSFTKEMLEDSGLGTKRDAEATHLYDRFRDRVMFPIYNRKGKVIGFGGRAIGGQDPKYLNSPETLVFKKGVHLFGVKQAQESIQKTGRAFVVEGYMDVLMLSQYEIENCVASMGTAITDDQMKQLFRLCRHVTFCLDGDRAGLAAAWKAAEHVLPLLDSEHHVDFLFIPDEMDPDEYVRAKGKEAFDQLAAHAKTLTEYILDVFIEKTDFSNGESLARFLSETNRWAEQVQNAVVKLSFQKRIAEVAGISLDTMLNMLKECKPQEVLPAIDPSQPHAPDEPTGDGQGGVVASLHSTGGAARPATDISVAAKLIGVAVLKDRQTGALLDTNYLGRFLSAIDKEMLFPLLAYISANLDSDDKALAASLAFNPHAKLIDSLILAAQLVGEKFDANAEINTVMESFKHMDRIYQIVRAAKPQQQAA